MSEAALAAADHALGNRHARWTLLEYGDYECPACIQAAPQMQHLVEASGGGLNFLFRHFPLVEAHPNAELAAEAAEAAAAQGKFWPMHQLLFAPPHCLSLAALTGHAEAIGLDMIRFKAEMADRIYTQRVQEHCRAGQQSRLRATPAFFLNGRPLEASVKFDQLADAVHAAVSRS